MWGLVVASPFGHQLQDPIPQTIFCRILLLLVILPVEELCGWTTYHDNPLRALPLQAEAYRGCMRCSGKPSNRTKLPDTMGNRRHSPTPGLPNLVATSLDPNVACVSRTRAQKIIFKTCHSLGENTKCGNKLLDILPSGRLFFQSVLMVNPLCSQERLSLTCAVL